MTISNTVTLSYTHHYNHSPPPLPPSSTDHNHHSPPSPTTTIPRPLPAILPQLPQLNPLYSWSYCHGHYSLSLSPAVAIIPYLYPTPFSSPIPVPRLRPILNLFLFLALSLLPALQMLLDTLCSLCPLSSSNSSHFPLPPYLPIIVPLFSPSLNPSPLLPTICEKGRSFTWEHWCYWSAIFSLTYTFPPYSHSLSPSYSRTLWSDFIILYGVMFNSRNLSKN